MNSIRSNDVQPNDIGLINCISIGRRLAQANVPSLTYAPWLDINFIDISKRRQLTAMVTDTCPVYSKYIRLAYFAVSKFYLHRQKGTAYQDGHRNATRLVKLQ